MKTSTLAQNSYHWPEAKQLKSQPWGPAHILSALLRDKLQAGDRLATKRSNHCLVLSKRKPFRWCICFENIQASMVCLRVLFPPPHTHLLNALHSKFNALEDIE